MANQYLSVVEQAYRATIEEQDDTALWFTHAMKNAGADVGVLLRGNAVNYAVKGQDASGLRFGNREMKHGPTIDKDVSALIGKQIPVYAVAEDIAERGIQAADLVAGVEALSRAALAKLFDNYQRIIHW